MEWFSKTLPAEQRGDGSDGMSTMKIFMPDSLKHFVDEQVARRGYGTRSEYVRALIRKEADRMHLRSLLLDGAGKCRLF